MLFEKFTKSGLVNFFKSKLTTSTTVTTEKQYAADATVVKNLQDQIDSLTERLYPVGSIYMSSNSTNPSELFGGTWEQLKDRFLLGAGTNYTAGNTGGEATHTLTVDEMPNHSHEFLKGANAGALCVNVNQNMSQTAYAQGFQEVNNNGWWNNAYKALSTIKAAGGSQAHNNMPPYLVVYIWKRIA